MVAGGDYQPRACGRRVVVAEDDERSRRLIGHVLERDGFEVVAVATGEEALAAVRAAPPDLLVLDIQLVGSELGWRGGAPAGPGEDPRHRGVGGRGADGLRGARRPRSGSWPPGSTGTSPSRSTCAPWSTSCCPTSNRPGSGSPRPVLLVPGLPMVPGPTPGEAIHEAFVVNGSLAQRVVVGQVGARVSLILGSGLALAVLLDGRLEVDDLGGLGLVGDGRRRGPSGCGGARYRCRSWT